jgi:hypothetical protein
LSNYISDAKLSTYEQKYSDGRNAVGAKFVKSFKDTTSGIQWTNENNNGTPTLTNIAAEGPLGYLSGAITAGGTVPATAAIINNATSKIIVS